MATQAARKAASAKAAPVEPKQEEPPVETAEEVVDLWADLEEELPQEYTRNVVISTRDLEAETSPAIKTRVNASYEAYVAEYNKVLAETQSKDKATVAASKAANRVQPCGTEKRAEEYLKLIKTYGKFKGYTIRGAVDPRDKTRVVWRAKPKESARVGNGNG